MLRILFRKEIIDLVQQRRYLLLLAAVGLVSLLTAYLSVQEYHQAERHAQSLVSTQQEILAQVTSPNSLTQLGVRHPSVLELIAPGITYDLGRWATNKADEAGDLTGSLYTQEPLFAIVRTIDPVYVIQIVLSLVALLLSHGLISQEREQGTLRLLFSHSVSRLSVFLAKGLAVLTALLPMLFITLLLPICFGLFSGITISGSDLLGIAGIGALAAVYLAVCVVIGLACSIWWQSARMSLLGSLTIWLLLCLAWPRLGMTITHLAISTTTEAEIAAQSAAFETDRWKQFESTLAELNRNPQSAQSDEEVWSTLQHSDSLRRLAEHEITDHTQLLRDDLIRQKQRQHQLAMLLARLSPASALALGSTTLAGTDPELSIRYYDALKSNYERFRTYVDEVSKTVPDNNRLSIMVSDENGKQSVHVSAPRKSDPLDLANMPAFVPPAPDPLKAGLVLFDFVALIGSFCLFGLIGLGKFLRADLR